MTIKKPREPGLFLWPFIPWLTFLFYTKDDI